MIKDKLYKDIVAAIAKGVEAETFERCAQELLRADYPTLVPVTGGSDDGFDGAVGTAEGPFPLICTTASDVIGNVRRNVGQYLKRPNAPRHAIVATTRVLTQLRRNNINVAAKKLGVQIVNIHDGVDFANRLYRHPEWRKALLGLSGDLPPLSVLPSRSRGNTTIPVIGRESELEQLRTGTGDMLVVGQPGSGKTYLHEVIAKDGGCLFAVSTDLGRIADFVRMQKPRCIVIDDAHTRLEFVDELRRLRTETGASFQVHANCWPNFKEQCRERLGIPESQIIQLEPLTRDEVVQLIRACGIAGPDQVMHMILGQSEGKPGLAAALAAECKRGNSIACGPEKLWLPICSGDERRLPALVTRMCLRHLGLVATTG